MKIAHIADLHIGKIVNGFSMIEEQRFVLKSIVKHLIEENIETLLIAGDVYDKRNPSDESVSLFNDFIHELSKLDIYVLIISGNHDSGIKLGFGNKLLEDHKIYISGKYKGELDHLKLQDEYGSLNFYLLPFIRPADVRVYDESVISYHDAIKSVIDNANLDFSQRNILISHQFYSSGQEDISDSEIISVGGTENVGYNLLLDFDYVALGHLHKPQQLKEEYIRYSGSIVKYSNSEVNDQKQMVIIDLKEKNDLSLSFIPLETEKKFISKKGYLDDLLQEEASEDYFFVTLKDDNVIDAIGKLRAKFPNIMSLDFDNQRTKSNQDIEVVEDIEDKDPKELFKQFYKLQNNEELSKSQEEIIEEILERIEDHAS